MTTIKVTPGFLWPAHRRCGLIDIGPCLNNAVGVLQACLHRKSAFTRTLKNGSTLAARWRYRCEADRSTTTAAFELALSLYCMVALAVYLVAAGLDLRMCSLPPAPRYHSGSSRAAHAATAPNYASG